MPRENMCSVFHDLFWWRQCKFYFRSVSFFVAPKRGIISRGMEQRKLQRMIMDENLLKELFHLGEKDHDLYKGRSIEEIIEERYFPEKTLRKSLNRLRRQGFLTKTNGDWRYTEAGKMKGQRVVKLHRLWELYLSEKMKIVFSCRLGCNPYRI